MESSRKPFATLRRFVRPRTPREACELCGLALAPEHAHLLELTSRRLACACEACAVLFSGHHSGRYRRVSRRFLRLPDFRLSDERWESLSLPVNLAFFSQVSKADRVLAQYPSPAGATEALLPQDLWEELVEDNPILRRMEPDVEGLLVNRVNENRAYYLAPLDQCYKLVGLIRTHWRGLSGGTQVWGQIAQFFAELEERSQCLT